MVDAQEAKEVLEWLRTEVVERRIALREVAKGTGYSPSEIARVFSSSPVHPGYAAKIAAAVRSWRDGFTRAGGSPCARNQ